MSLRIRFQGGPRAGEVLWFDDDVETIVFGRDGQRCQVVFPAEQTQVGREHCALRRVLGRYRLQLNRDNLVLVNGEQAVDEQELEADAELQFGPGGPVMVVETGLRPDLAATLAQGRREGQATMLRGADRRSRRGRNLALAAVLLLVAAGAAGYAVHRGLRQRQEQAQQDMAALSAQAAGQLRQIGALEKTVASVAEQADAVARALEQARPSVYMVVLRFQKEAEQAFDETGHGTAWVVGEGVLATNAHVARIMRRIGQVVEGYEPLGVLREVVVRSPGPEPRTHRLETMQMHPGFEAFDELWGRYQPAEGVQYATSRRIQAPGSACDVALLRVHPEDSQGLAKPLPLAPIDRLRQLRAGEPVGFVGYPMEDLAVINIRNPAPAVQIGRLTGVTNYFGAPSVDAQGHCLGQLVQHALPSAGGASGSPILNGDGQVVALLSGGNVVMVDGGRVSKGAGINFAQRADLLAELLERRADDAQAERLARWQHEIQTFASDAELQRRDLVANLVLRIQAELAGDQPQYRHHAVRLHHAAHALDAAEPVQWHLPVPEAGKCLVLALAGLAGQVELAVTDGQGRRHAARPLEPEQQWNRLVLLDAQPGATLRGTLSGSPAGETVELFVYQFTRQRITPDVRRAMLLEEWLERCKGPTGHTLRAQQLFQADGKLDRVSGAQQGAARAAVRIPAAGHCLAVAVAPGGEDIDLFVVRGVRAIAQDEQFDSYPAAAFDAEQPETLTIHVVGPEPGIDYELRVYQAVAE